MTKAWRWYLGVAFILWPGAAGPLSAQATPADTAAVLYQVAQRADEGGDRRLAQALLRLITRQYPDTPTALEAARWLDQLEGVVEAESGHVELMVWGTTYGAWLGVAIPAALSADDPTPYGAGLVLGAPVGFAAARAFARSGPMSVGQARTIRFASMWGTWQGIGWREVLNIGTGREAICDQFGCYDYGTSSDEAPISAAVIGGLTGIGVGAALARSRNITGATATMVELASLWGSWFGLAGGVVFGAEEDALLTTTLLAGNAGLLAAALAAPGLDISAGRARLISVVGLAGALAGIGIDLLTEVDDEKAALGIPLVTSAIGLGVGVSITRNQDRNRSLLDERSSLAMIELRDGRLGLGVPIPTPAMIPRGFDGLRVGSEPGVRLPLVSASF